MIKKEPFYYREVKLTFVEVMVYIRMLELAIERKPFDLDAEFIGVVKKMQLRFGKQTGRNFNKITKQLNVK